jgi:NAD(P)H dehydrogenase (quinone)
MIVVTGATGALNGATVEHLLERIPADQIAVSVRDTAKAQHFADRGVRVRPGRYEDPAALLDSFEGADQVLLVSSNDPSADGVSLLRVGIDTAVAAGARRILRAR